MLDEIANITPASASKSNLKQPTLKTPQKEASSKKSVVSPMELRPPFSPQEITYTESGLSGFDLEQLKYIYKKLTGKTTRVKTETTMRKKIIDFVEKETQNELAREDIIDLTEQSDAEAMGRGLKKANKKHSKATKRSKASKHFIHFK